MHPLFLNAHFSLHLTMAQDVYMLWYATSLKSKYTKKIHDCKVKTNLSLYSPMTIFKAAGGLGGQTALLLMKCKQKPAGSFLCK